MDRGPELLSGGIFDGSRESVLECMPDSGYNGMANSSDGMGEGRLQKLIREITEELGKITGPGIFEDSCTCIPPDRKAAVRVIKNLQALLFPLCFSRQNEGMPDDELLAKTAEELKEQIRIALCFNGWTKNAEMTAEEKAKELTKEFLRQLPRVKSLLLKDVEALYEGDPAAKRREEVMICYPGFYAISIFRLAHELQVVKVPLLPRMMTEYAHEKTGIDIHPGATIGEFFFIDHGTGIVVGETTVIGDHVKLYQGVTLGARSFELDADGNPVKGIKRHPDIGSHVVIYANATILGGDTVIGDHCVIGGNTWLTRSVPAGSVVAYREGKEA